MKFKVDINIRTIFMVVMKSSLIKNSVIKYFKVHVTSINRCKTPLSSKTCLRRVTGRSSVGKPNSFSRSKS